MSPAERFFLSIADVFQLFLFLAVVLSAALLGFIVGRLPVDAPPQRRLAEDASEESRWREAWERCIRGDRSYPPMRAR